MKQLNEGLNYLDMENQVIPVLGIDKYISQTGSDSQTITLSFTVKAKMVAEDLAEWLEKGYDWIIDADTSPGEVTTDRYVTFAEINRRSSAPTRIMEILDDLETLTNIKAKDWTLMIDDTKYPASKEAIKEHVILDPTEYKNSHEQELNEWRNRAGLETVKSQDTSEDLKAWQRQAGII
jgi:hypothetical protein